ncbi:hypothetical protein [Flavobacterium sedimenticola]|uniref:Lipocalin-like domain-containing protein n=1 Tax=Flavobacterium sedimenticola TaxID=3043286 RepID=A0ABT6XRB1_9FLAO|nr:hypothetical protein [Flavobacterium sedimenticola]MDI9257387.1 hypothetical protein [Flavobacterium sedimenticola]
MAKLKYLVWALTALLMLSCQEEEETIIQDNAESFTTASPLVGLLSRTAQNPTATDNVLDNSSCFSVQLPVIVIVNNQQITVSSAADYQTVQDAIDAFSDDDDLVNFIYPITIQYQNFQTQVLQNANDLDDVLDDCGDDDGFDEIDCIALVYPIVVDVYDSNNQLANTVTITGNSSLYNFLNNLSNNVYVAINFPISAVNANGQTIIITSNAQLENFIEDSIDDCDDNSNGGGSGGATLVQSMTSGTWYISYAVHENDVETSYYNGYNFTFNPNETILAQRNANTINGDWDISDDSGSLRLSLNFDGSLLEHLETNWRVIEFNATTIRLKKETSDGTDYLTFTKN